MNVLELLNMVREGKITPEEAERQLRVQPFIDLGYAKADTHRLIRQGATEVIYGAGKTPDQVTGIARALTEGGASCVLVTRCDRDMFQSLGKEFDVCTYRDDARICIIGNPPSPSPNSCVAVVTAGTSDIPVAEEAAVTAEALGSRVERIYDVGVAGIHRLLSKVETLSAARAVVVVAGMEGALPSVVGGLVSVPVIAVPTSVGYGSSFEGLSALLSMMNSCSSNVSVVNIDNGFGGGFIAHNIDRRSAPL